MRGKLSKTCSGSGYQLSHSCLSLDINHGYRESGVRVAQACITIIQCCTDVFKFSICYFPSKSCCKTGVATCAGLTSWRHIVIILHIGSKSLIITSFEVLIKTEIDLGGDLSDWAALFRESTAHPVNWEDARKGPSNIVCLTKLVRLLWLTTFHVSRNNPNRIQSKRYAKERYKINICCWNVRTLLDLPSSKCPEQRTALVSRELGRLNIDIAALSETRLAEEDQLIEKGPGYSIFRVGKTKSEKHEGSALVLP